MAVLRGLLGSSERKPSSAAVLEDDVYPVHMLDGTEDARKFILAWTMRFNDVLDANKLHDALSRLLEIGDWKKLGGRLRLKGDGKLEIHVPKKFTVERPAVAFSHTVLEMGIDEHPVASRLPKPTVGPSIQPKPPGFHDLIVEADIPATIEEWIRRDAPQLSLHVISFNDATIVGLAWPHTLMDAFGQQALLHAWSLVLAGREDEVPSVLGARTDVLWDAADPKIQNGGKQEELVIEKMRLKGVNLAMFLCRFAKDAIRSPVVETRILFLPKDTLDKIRDRAQEEAAESGSGAEKSFVSEADVLAAWATRMAMSSEPKTRRVTVLSALNARFRLQSLLKPEGVYIQNMVLVTYAFLPPEISKGSVGQIALTHRRHLHEQSSKEQVLSYLRATRKLHEAGKEMKPFFGETDALPIVINNMTKAETFKAADFSAAVLRQGEKLELRSNPSGTMVYSHFQALNPSATRISWFIVLGKDHDGNCWIGGGVLPQVWATIEEELKKI